MKDKEVEKVLEEYYNKYNVGDTMADDDTEEYKKDIEKEKRRLLRDKKVLQSLLEKE